MAAVWIVLLGLGTLLAGCTAPRSDPPTNLIVISVDTLRADHMSLYGYGRDTTPRLASFADRAVTFELARASWPKNPEHDVDVDRSPPTRDRSHVRFSRSVRSG